MRRPNARANRSRPLTAALWLSAAGCGAPPPALDPAPPVSAPARPQASAEERAACDGSGNSDLRCLRAVARRRAAGDDVGGDVLLEEGCARGDVDACLDRAARARAAGDDQAARAFADEAMKRCGPDETTPPAVEERVACARARSKVTFEDAQRTGALGVRDALALRAAHGPALLEVFATVRDACTPGPWREARSVDLGATALGRDGRWLDAAAICPAPALGDASDLADGTATQDFHTPRTLRDGVHWDRPVLMVRAPASDGLVVQVSCPSRLVDDERAVDVSVIGPSAPGLPAGEVRLVGAVRADFACLGEASHAQDRAARAQTEQLLGASRAALDAALDVVASRCDAGPVAAQANRGPLDVGALVRPGAFLAAEGSCRFGHAAVALPSPHEVTDVGRMSRFTVAALDRTVGVTLFPEVGRVVFTLRRRDGQLQVERPLPAPTR